MTPTNKYTLDHPDLIESNFMVKSIGLQRLNVHNLLIMILELLSTTTALALSIYGLSEPEFFGDSVYKLKKIVSSHNFSVQFIKIITHYKKICYNINLLQQTAYLVVNPIVVGTFAFLFNCTPVGRTSDTMTAPT